MKINGAGKSGGRYLKIGDTLFQSLAFRTLPGSAAKLWLDARTLYTGGNNGRIMLTLSALQARGWNSQGKLVRATRELLQRGLLCFTRRCGPNTYHKASLYAFADLDVARFDDLGIAGAKASQEFLRWLPGMTFDPRDSEPDTVFPVVPNQDPNGSRIRTATGPESGQRTPETGPESGQRRKGRKPAPSLDLRGIEMGKRTLS